VTNGLSQLGWSEQASALDGALVRCESCFDTTPAADLGVDSLHRIEGASDPGDMAVVVAFTCPHCSSRDALVLRYGPEATATEAEVLVALPEPPARESDLPG
jgi:hypothetical protein